MIQTRISVIVHLRQFSSFRIWSEETRFQIVRAYAMRRALDACASQRLIEWRLRSLLRCRAYGLMLLGLQFSLCKRLRQWSLAASA
eukprot:1152237-Pleurochrysis_carterae.AAC.1